jgi:hypothetical protein
LRNVLFIEKKKGANCNIYYGYLSYHSKICENYGVENENYSIVKNGGKILEILLNRIAEVRMYFRLWKQQGGNLLLWLKSI